MSCTTREKYIRNKRRLRSNNPTASGRSEEHLTNGKRDNGTVAEIAPNPAKKSVVEEMPKEKEIGIEESEESDWGYCTQEQLEDLLLKSLEFVYNKAVCKIASGGYNGDDALSAVLGSGHYYGSGDLLSYIVENAMTYLKNSINNCSNKAADIVFRDLKQLQEYAFTRMVCFVQQLRPELSKGDAMWSLLMSDLHVGRASFIEIPSMLTADERSGINSSFIPIGVPSEPCRMRAEKKRISGLNVAQANKAVVDALSLPHNGFTFDGGTSQTPSTSPAQLTLNVRRQSFLKLSLLKRNAACLLQDYKSKSALCSPSDGSKSEDLVCTHGPRKVQTQSGSSSEKKQFLTQDMNSPTETAALSTNIAATATSFSVGITSTVDAAQGQFKEKPRNCPDTVEAILESLEQMGVSEKSDGVEQRNEMMMRLMHQIRDLEMQLKDQIEWAQQTSMQAARKLSKDLTELKQLRIESGEILYLKNDKQALEDTRMKRVAEMENALRKASGQIDQSNAAVKRLATENAELRAEMEASKLNAAELVATWQEVEKREKKCLRRAQTREKQKSKIQGEINEVKQNISQVQKQLSLIKNAQQETEKKLKQDEKDKVEAIAQAEEVRRAKDAAAASANRREESLHRKTETDFQRHLDDIERLEEELTRMKAMGESFQPNTMPYSQNAAEEEASMKILKEKNVHLLHKLHNLKESSRREGNHDRQCVMCMNEQVSVVFLPCAHQVVCIKCNNLHEKKGLKDCPFCTSLIQQRIHVYGVSLQV